MRSLIGNTIFLLGCVPAVIGCLLLDLGTVIINGRK